ncbi:hypothetical protein EDB83DRAFT_2453934, partial [Lactarius deliciosus]
METRSRVTITHAFAPYNYQYCNLNLVRATSRQALRHLSFMHVHVRIDARRRLVARLDHEVILHSSTFTTSMSQTTSTTAASSRFQLIFDAALKSYQKKTGKNLSAHPLASQLQSCDSTSAILAVLQHQVQEFDQAHSGDERLTKWLIPTVNVLYAFSAAVSEGVGLVSPDT